MGKAVTAILGGVVIGLAIFATGGAATGLFGAIVGKVGATLGVTAMAASAITGGLYAGALYGISSLLKPKLPNLSSEFGREIQLNGDPLAPRKICYGEAWTSGTLRYRNTTGTNNQELYLAIVLAGHQIASVEAVEADGETLTLDGSGNVTSPSKWAGLIQIRYKLGTDSQTVDSALDAAFANWTSDHRLLGCAYARVWVVFDEEDLNTLPQFRFKIRGQRVYDPRLDSTNGGTGTHRLDTQATWAWSNNPVLCANDFLRGIRFTSRRIAGLGVADTRFDWANVIAEANICDESVALDGGGTQARYTVNGFIDPRQDHGSNLRHFEVAMAGDITFADGKWRFFAGAYRAPTLLLEAKHFIGPLRHLVHKGAAARVDTAQGSYASSDESGTAVDYPMVRLASATVGQEEIFPVSFALVNNSPQAQRCAKLLLERESAGKTISCTTSLYGLRAVPGETIEITHAAFGLTAQDMRVLDVQLTTQQVDDKMGLAVDMTLEAGPASLYAWDAEETEIAAAPELVQANVPFVVMAFDDLVSNLINPSFETGTLDGWTTVSGGAAYTVVTTDPHFGTYHLHGVPPDSGTCRIRNNARIQVDEGDRVLAQGFVRRTGTGSANTHVQVVFRDAAGSEISSPDGNVVTGTAYELSRVFAVAPATSAVVDFEFVIRDSDGPTLQADGAYMAIMPKDADIDIGEASGAVDTSRIDLNAASEVLYSHEAGPVADTSPTLEPGSKGFNVELIALDVQEATDVVFVSVSGRVVITGSIDLIVLSAFASLTGASNQAADSATYTATGEDNFSLSGSFTNLPVDTHSFGLFALLVGNPPSAVTATFHDVNVTVARFKR